MRVEAVHSEQLEQLAGAGHLFMVPPAADAEVGVGIRAAHARENKVETSSPILREEARLVAL